MLQLIYQSIPSRDFENDDCANILIEARRNNPEKGITGALIYTGKHFLQVLEGPEDAVRECFATVKMDRRHKNVECLAENTISEPEFGRWSMAFERASMGQKGELESQLNFLLKNVSNDTRDVFIRVLEQANCN